MRTSRAESEKESHNEYHGTPRLKPRATCRLPGPAASSAGLVAESSIDPSSDGRRSSSSDRSESRKPAPNKAVRGKPKGRQDAMGPMTCCPQLLLQVFRAKEGVRSRRGRSGWFPLELM